MTTSATCFAAKSCAKTVVESLASPAEVLDRLGAGIEARPIDFSKGEIAHHKIGYYKIKKRLIEGDQAIDNFGVFEVTDPKDLSRKLIAKIPAYQKDFDLIARKNKFLSDSGLGAKFVSTTEIEVDGTKYKAFVSEKVEGYSSKDPRCLPYVTDRTMEEVKNALEVLSFYGVLPLDFQFIVRPDAGITLIDADLYESTTSLKENHLLGDREPERVEDNVKRLINKMADPAQSDTIFGIQVFKKLAPVFKLNVTNYVHALKKNAQKMLSIAQEARNYSHADKITPILKSAAQSMSRIQSGVGPKTKIADLPQVTFLPLGKQEQDSIRSHPIYERLKSYRDKKKGFQLTLTGHGTSTATRSNPIAFDKFGESIQLAMLQKILDFATESDVDSAQNKAIGVYVSDLAEIVSSYKVLPKSRTEKSADFNMVDLKKGNPTYSSIPDRTHLRKALGIPEDRRVLSLYGSSQIRNSGEILSALNSLVSKEGILFISDGGKPLEDNPYYMGNNFKDFKVLPLSQVGPLTYKLFPKLLIYNDVKGKLPYLHAIADMAIINGPINPYEPLSVRTPTVIMENEGAEYFYDPNVFQQQIKIAQQTGGGVSATTSQDILRAFENRAQSSNITPPHLLKSGNPPRSHFETILDQLLLFLEHRGEI